MRRTASALLAAAMLLLSFAPGANAATLFHDDFFDKIPGSIASNPGGWIPLANATSEPANAWVSRLPTDNTLSMQLYGAHSGCWCADAVHEVPFPADPAIPVFIRFTLVASGDIVAAGGSVCPENAYDIGARVVAGTSWSASSLANLIIVRANQVDDGVTVFDPLDNVANPIQPNTPYTVTVRVNRVAGTKAFWLDGRYWDGTYDPALVANGPGLTHLAFTSGGGKGWIKAPVVFTDTAAPVTTATLSGTRGDDGTTYRSPVTIALSAQDADTFVSRSEYSIDNVSWNSYSAPVPISAQGTTVVRYRSIDVAGNIETPKTVSFKIDTVPPTSAPALAPANGATGVAISVAIRATYNETVVKGANASAIQLYNVTRGRIVAAGTSTSGAVLTIQPSSALSRKTLYRVTIPAGALKDSTGNPTTSTTVWTFTTN